MATSDIPYSLMKNDAVPKKMINCRLFFLYGEGNSIQIKQQCFWVDEITLKLYMQKKLCKGVYPCNLKKKYM